MEGNTSVGGKPASTTRESSYRPPNSGWLAQVPAPVVPYVELVRLHKPHGIYMIYYPYLLGLIYASLSQVEPIPLSTLLPRSWTLLVWTVLLRSAACAWNDNIDQDYDRQTARCRTRPIARGAISTGQGHVFALAVILAGFLSLKDLPKECSYCAVATTALSILYPFGKRFTNYPQVILGSALASAIPLAAFSVERNVLAGPTLLPTASLCVAVVLLVIFYDVVYARQDTADDVRSGVKSMAVLFRNQITSLLTGVTFSVAALLVILGQHVQASLAYYVASAAAAPSLLLVMVSVVQGSLYPGLAKQSGWIYVFAIVALMSGFSAEYGLRLQSYHWI